jgi:hypothetical protein
MMPLGVFLARSSTKTIGKGFYAQRDYSNSMKIRGYMCGFGSRPMKAKNIQYLRISKEQELDSVNKGLKTYLTHSGYSQREVK